MLARHVGHRLRRYVDPLRALARNGSSLRPSAGRAPSIGSVGAANRLVSLGAELWDISLRYGITVTEAVSSSALRASLAGRFAVGELAGKGGMGEVYAGHAPDGARVAIKRVAAGTVADVARFVHEAEVLERLRHPHVVDYVEHGVTSGGDHYLVTEWIDGQSLCERLRAGPLSVDETIALAHGVAEALVAAHAAGLIHRDLKPSNLMLPGGRAADVKVIDFGIARAIGEGGGVTATGEIVGTPGFLAPEQARGQRVLDGRADLFGLGTILYEAITGKPAFAADDLMTTLAMVLMHAPPPIAEVRDGVPPRLVALIDRLMAKEPGDRPASAAEVIAELDAIARGEPPVRAQAPARSTDAPTVPARRGSGRRRAWPIAAGLVVAGAAVAIAVVPTSRLADAPAWLGPCTKDDPSGCAARCDAREADACYLLGEMTAWGQAGVTQDRAKGIELMFRACDARHLQACLRGAQTLDAAAQAGEVPDGWQREYFRRLETTCGRGLAHACATLVRAMIARRVPGTSQQMYQLLEAGCRTGDRETCAMIKFVPKDAPP
jgi:hypothetical protein